VTHTPHDPRQTPPNRPAQRDQAAGADAAGPAPPGAAPGGAPGAEGAPRDAARSPGGAADSARGAPAASGAEAELGADRSGEADAASRAAQSADAASVDLEEEVRRLRADLDDARDRALRFQAEMDNFRKRVAREIEAERRHAAAPLLADLLGVLDNIRRAIAAGQQAAQGDSLLEGVRLVAQQLEDVLRRHHCVPIEALHAPFDPHVHEAVCQQPTDEFPPNTVVQVLREGYQLHDRVIRPSQVVVSTSPQPNEQE